MSTDTFSKIAIDKGSTGEYEPLPEDIPTEINAHPLVINKREQLEADGDLPKQTKNFISRPQREYLDQQIEQLYERVANDLSDCPQDLAYAFEKLRQAQDTVLENVQQYEEALHKVFVVNQMLITKNNWKRWAYTWGMALFFYAIVWLAALLAGFIAVLNTLPTAGGLSFWYAALAGGVGGCVTILYDLSWHVSVKNDFDRQYLMKYLVQPILGFVQGGVIYLIVGAGFLVINSMTVEPSDTYSGAILSIQVVLGFWAGFRRHVVFDLANSIGQRLKPAKSV